MVDFTPLVQAVITLAAAAITVFLIPWLKERYGNETLEKARHWVQIAVYAAEKLYGAGNGDQKLEYAEAFLAQHKIKLDTSELIALVNAEIKNMELAEVAKVGEGVLMDEAILEGLVEAPPDDGEDEPE